MDLERRMPRSTPGSGFKPPAGVMEDEDSNQEDQERSYLGADRSTEDEGGPTQRKRANKRGTAASSSHQQNNAGSQMSACRHDSSLGLLTKNFLGLLEASSDGIVDRNKAADILKVKKRRIYDITNVLEGVGLLQKKSKNNVQWTPLSVGPNQSPAQQKEMERLRADNKVLEEVEAQLDEQLASMATSLEALCSHPLNKEKMYITDTLIRSLPCFASETIFAMRAPAGTTIQLAGPEGDSGEAYSLKVRSSQGLVEVYLVHHAEEVQPTDSPRPQYEDFAPSLALQQHPNGMHPAHPLSATAAMAGQLLPFSPMMKPEPFTPGALGFAGLLGSPFAPRHGGSPFAQSPALFDTNGWAHTSTALSLFEAFRDEDGHGLGAQPYVNANLYAHGMMGGLGGSGPDGS